MISKYMNPLAVIVLANDEECVIEGTVKSIVSALSPGDILFVIADHCTDDTAEIAERAGAQVVIRNDGLASGKGNALSWFTSKFKGELLSFSMAVILDADSVICSDFFEKTRMQCNSNRQAFQSFVYPIIMSNSPIGKLAALSELIDQRVSDRVRTIFKWPVRFRGTGMVLRPDTLVEVSPLIDTYVEDIALSLLLTARGIAVSRIDQAVVFDPKPSSSFAAAQQRARWFRGQWQALWRYRWDIFRILKKGPPGWALLCSLFLRPKWLVMIVSVLFALAFSRWIALSIFFWSCFIGGLIFLIFCMVVIPEKDSFFRALLHVPAYLWMWFHSLILSLQESSWRRTRIK